MRTLIRRGMIITAQDEFEGDILIDDEKIISIGINIDENVDTIIDAKGKFVVLEVSINILTFQRFAMWEVKILQAMKRRMLLLQEEQQQLSITLHRIRGKVCWIRLITELMSEQS